MKRNYVKPEMSMKSFAFENIITSSSEKIMRDVETGIRNGNIFIDGKKVEAASKIITVTW